VPRRVNAYIHQSLPSSDHHPLHDCAIHFSLQFEKKPHWISYFTTSTKQCSLPMWRLLKNNKNGESYQQVQGLRTLVLLLSTSPKRCWIKFESWEIDLLVWHFKPKNLPTLVLTLLVNHKGSNLWLWNLLGLCLTPTQNEEIKIGLFAHDKK
jgi:hypothetical protein